MFATKYRMWIRKRKQEKLEVPVPAKLVDALITYDSLMFRNIRVLLRLALNISVTSCERQRIFSQLKLVKSCCRSTMSTNRLSGLAPMKINRFRCDKLSTSQSELDELVYEFMQLYPRQLKLHFLLADDAARNSKQTFIVGEQNCIFHCAWSQMLAESGIPREL